MTAAAVVQEHRTAAERLGFRRYRAWCRCGWAAPVRQFRISAADDTAAHLLEVSQ